MSIVHVKGWHAVLAGLVCGALFSLGCILSQDNEPIGGDGFVSRNLFEQKLRTRTAGGSSYIRSIAISRRRRIDLVTFEMLDEPRRAYVERQLAAPRPYTPPGAHKPYRSIEAYLLTVRATIPSLDVRHAWWDEPWPMVLLWTAGGALAGGIWPLVRWLTLPRLPQPESNRFATGPQPDQAPSGTEPTMTDADRRHLAALEAEMIAGLASGEAEASELVGSVLAEPSPVRELRGDAVAAPQPAPAEAKEYAGEYYPVAKKAPHGFTLVELLVTIGVIVVLLAILMPVIARAREHAKQSQCASNLRQIGAGLEIYNQAYRALPLVASNAGVNAAMNDVKVVGVMRCPDDEPGTLSYAMNAAYAGLPKAQGNAADPMAFETGVGHRGLYNTVYFDGHVDAQPRGSQ